jgi:hypothetical protein
LISAEFSWFQSLTPAFFGASYGEFRDHFANAKRWQIAEIVPRQAEVNSAVMRPGGTGQVSLSGGVSGRLGRARSLAGRRGHP